jgi:putative ABC transport system permease protein
MRRFRFWRVAWKIAWRDLWSGRKRFVVALAALAVGVAAMDASRAVGSQFSRCLRGDMRHWIAADAAVTVSQSPSEEQRGELVELARQGIEETESLEAYGMASSDRAADPALVSIRSVDPFRYPWYGAVELEPNRPLREALEPDTAVVSRTLAERLAVAPGDRILLNGVDFRIAALLASEPDRFAAAPNAYPRVLLSGAAFDRARIVRLGNTIVWRLLFRMAAGRDAAGLKARLQQVFPDGQVVDYRDHGDARVAAALDAALTCLDLTAWTALALGSLGVAMVIYLHIERQLDTVAVIKALGGRWSQILRIYLLEIAGLSLAGCAIGAALALPLEWIFLQMARDQLLFPAAFEWRWPPAAEAVILGAFSSLAAVAAPLAAVRAAAPMPLLRRYVERPPAARCAGRMVGLAFLVGMAALALWMAHSWKTGAAFLFGLTFGGLILVGGGRGLLRAMRWAAQRWKPKLPVAWFHGTANLSRPGRRGTSRFVALAVGVMMVTASWLSPAAVARAIEQSLPMPGADLFVFGLGPSQTGPLMELLAHNPDVNQPVELLPAVILRLSKVAGVPIPVTAPERWVATCSSGTPPGRLSAGRWWRPGAAEPEAVMAESLAGRLGVTVGGTLEFFSNNRAIPARIVGLRRLDAIEELRGGLLFPCSAFAGPSVFYEAGISVRSSRVDAVRRAIAESYPSVPVISRGELAAAFQSVAHDAIWIMRVVSVLILAAGAVILVLMALAEEKTRTREIAILKALGARPSQVRNGLLADLASLGALAGASGGVMGSAFASLLLSVVFRKVATAWDVRVLVGATALGVLTAVAAGWASSARTLGQKPFAILRDE